MVIYYLLLKREVKAEALLIRQFFTSAVFEPGVHDSFLSAPFLISTVHAFLPSINSAEEKSETKDHTLITRNGLLKTVIYFFFHNPQYQKDESSTNFLHSVLSELGEEPTAGKDAMDTTSSQI